jgi:hypothetical protein
MKVIKEPEVPTSNGTTNEKFEINSPENQAKLAAAQEKFDKFQNNLTTKEYDLYLTAEQTTGMMETIFPKMNWKGYEAYAVSETYKTLNQLTNKKGEVKGGVKAEIAEAVFHFLKEFQGVGIEYAEMFKAICDQFAMVINEINKDRQELRDLSLELISLEQGIPVEDVVRNLQKDMQQQG